MPNPTVVGFFGNFTRPSKTRGFVEYVVRDFDLLNAAKSSASDPQWLGFYNEAYLLAAVIYFVLCFGDSRYSLWLE